MRKYLFHCLVCVSMYPSFSAHMVGMQGRGIWGGYCASNADGQFGFNTNTQKDCCIALKKSGRSISAQDKQSCADYWSSENSHNNASNTQSTMVGGDGTQMYCGSLGPAYRKKCCQDMIHRHMNNTITMNDNNKFACVDVLRAQVAQGRDSVDDADRKKTIALFDRMMKLLMMRDSAPVDAQDTTAHALLLTSGAKAQGGMSGAYNV